MERTLEFIREDSKVNQSIQWEMFYMLLLEHHLFFYFYKTSNSLGLSIILTDRFAFQNCPGPAFLYSQEDILELHTPVRNGLIFLSLRIKNNKNLFYKHCEWSQ